jgi:hypothetical protein
VPLVCTLEEEVTCARSVPPVFRGGSSMSTAVSFVNTIFPCLAGPAQLRAPSLCIYILEIGT